MSITPSYAHSTDAHLALVQIGGVSYYLKDADLRAIVEAFGTATEKDYADTVVESGLGLPTQSAVYDFVIDKVGDLGTVLNLLSASDHTAVADPQKGDFVVEADAKEWLYDGSAWREIGDESAYVLKTTQIAGIDLSDSITSTELSTALDLKALAHKDNASTTLQNYVTGVSSFDYTPAGNITVTLDQTGTTALLESSNYTPTGDVSVVLSETSTTASVDYASYTPAGTVSVTPSTASFYEVASIGKSASVNESSASFAVAGLVASVGTGADSETLIFTDATTSNALYAINFDAGELPSLASEATNFVTGISSASFSGTEASEMKVTNVAYTKTTLSSATFSGNEVANAIVTKVTYDKASVVASETTFSGTSTSFSPTLISESKDITVS